MVWTHVVGFVDGKWMLIGIARMYIVVLHCLNRVWESDEGLD